MNEMRKYLLISFLIGLILTVICICTGCSETEQNNVSKSTEIEQFDENEACHN